MDNLKSKTIIFIVTLYFKYSYVEINLAQPDGNDLLQEIYKDCSGCIHCGMTSISNPTQRSGNSIPTLHIASRLARKSGNVLRTESGKGLR